MSPNHNWTSSMPLLVHLPCQQCLPVTGFGPHVSAVWDFLSKTVQPHLYSQFSFQSSMVLELNKYWPKFQEFVLTCCLVWLQVKICPIFTQFSVPSSHSPEKERIFNNYFYFLLYSRLKLWSWLTSKPGCPGIPGLPGKPCSPWEKRRIKPRFVLRSE